VLVLSEAVLVIVIDVSIIRCAGLSDAIESHRHPSQHRFHRSIILDLNAFCRHQYVLDRGTLQGRTACDVEKSSTIFEAAFSVALGDVSWDRLCSTKPLIARVTMWPLKGL
jgi:hypothetical protein